jgi:hypothetical protein
LQKTSGGFFAQPENPREAGFAATERTLQSTLYREKFRAEAVLVLFAG